MQSAINSSKQNAMLVDKLDLMESMAMAQAMAIAKFQKDMNGRMEMSEGMLMSQSHISSKNQKAINDRITALEAMMMQSAMTAGKQTGLLSNIKKMVEALEESSDEEEEQEEAFTLDPETLKKVKQAAYEKLAKDKGVTVEELKAQSADMNEEQKQMMKEELSSLASKAVNRAHIKRQAGMELAAAKGFDGIEGLEAHIKTCPEEEKAALLKQMNELATAVRTRTLRNLHRDLISSRDYDLTDRVWLQALEASKAPTRSGKSLWKTAKVMLPFASAVKTLNDIPVALAKAIAEADVDPEMVKADAMLVQVAVPIAPS